MASIVVVEDNEDLAFGLKRALERDGHTVHTAPDGIAGLATVRASRPALIILDVMLSPGGPDGFQTLTSLRAAGFEMPVLFLTARGDETDKVYGLRLGADDFVTKPFNISELSARVRSLLRRNAALQPEPGTSETYQFGDVSVEIGTRIVMKGDRTVALTPREFDLLVELLRHPGVALSRVKLLRKVWGHAAEIMTRTIDIHIVELRRKLEDDNTSPRHLITVRKSGYRFDP